MSTEELTHRSYYRCLKSHTVPSDIRSTEKMSKISF